jgi:hypothetical protein
MLRKMMNSRVRLLAKCDGDAVPPRLTTGASHLAMPGRNLRPHQLLSSPGGAPGRRGVGCADQRAIDRLSFAAFGGSIQQFTAVDAATREPPVRPQG